MSAANYPCPACGKETKVMHDPVTRICSLCRKVSFAKDCVASNAPVSTRKDPSLDMVGANDDVQVGIETKAVAPLHPCYDCGKETKDAGGGWRGCKACDCKHCLGCGETDLDACTCDCGCDPTDESADHLLSCPVVR